MVYKTLRLVNLNININTGTRLYSLILDNKVTNPP